MIERDCKRSACYLVKEAVILLRQDDKCSWVHHQQSVTLFLKNKKKYSSMVYSFSA